MTHTTDPRDAPGTDDHDRLCHPHGDAVVMAAVYLQDDLASFTRAAGNLHTAISVAYLRTCRDSGDLQPAPLCRGVHVETLTGLTDLPHGGRAVAASHIARVEAATGAPAAVIRAWRHVGEDCAAAEAHRCCGQVPSGS